MRAISTIETLLATWVEAFNNHDLDLHAGLYLEDAMLFGSIPALVIGRQAIREYFSRRGPNVCVRHYPFPHILQLSEGIVATAAHVDFADGDNLVPYRVTWMLVQRGGNWHIAQHHGSPRI
jgi:ketosteroid isomerase-like protein